MNVFCCDKQNTPVLKAAVNVLLLTVALVGLFWFFIYRSGVSLNFSFFMDYRVRIWDGFLATIAMSLASLVVSLVIGLVSATMQGSKILLLRYLSKLYVAVIRGTPLISQIYLFYYIAGTALGIDNRFFAGVVILSIFEGAYISEIIRGSLLSMDTAQLEAAKAVGFTRRQILRHVVIPQLIARTLPALTGQFASIIKDSSLLSIIAMVEITQTIREITAINLDFFGPYIALSLMYLALTLPVSLFSKWVERRFSYENRN